MIETGITAFTYIECAKQIHQLISASLFNLPVSALGSVYDDKLNIIQDFNWNEVQKECAEFIADLPAHQIH